MSQHIGRSSTMREVPPEWDELMKIAAQIKFGEIVVRVQNGTITFTEYTIKRKPEESDDLNIFAV